MNENARTELAGRFLTWVLDHEIMFGFMQNKRYQNGPSQQVVNLAAEPLQPGRAGGAAAHRRPSRSARRTSTTRASTCSTASASASSGRSRSGVRHTDYTNMSVTGTYAVKSNTPAYGLIWKPRQDTSVYASYIEGLEEGGTAPLSTNNGGQVLPPGVSKQNELGVRTEAFAGLHALGRVLHHRARDGLHQRAPTSSCSTGAPSTRASNTRPPARSARQLSVYLSGMFLDAKQTNAQNTALIGKAPDNTPKQTHSLFVDYRPSFLPGVGRQRRRLLHQQALHQQPRAGLDPGLHASSRSARATRPRLWARKLTTFQVYVENLADKRYWSAAGRRHPRAWAAAHDQDVDEGGLLAQTRSQGPRASGRRACSSTPCIGSRSPSRRC